MPKPDFRRAFYFLPFVSVLLFGSCAQLGRFQNAETPGGLGYTVLKGTPSPGSGRRFPLIIVLHGGGERADPYLAAWDKDALRRRAMVVAPDWGYWQQMEEKQTPEAALEIVEMTDQVLERYPEADPERIILVGVSAGAFLAEQIVRRDPQKWKAVVFAAYGARNDWARQIGPQKLPAMLWLHGKKDTVISSARVQLDVTRLKSYGAKTEWIEDQEAGHEFREEWAGKILNWLETVISNPRRG